MHQGFVHLDGERPAAELDWSFLFLVNLGTFDWCRGFSLLFFISYWDFTTMIHKIILQSEAGTPKAKPLFSCASILPIPHMYNWDITINFWPSQSSPIESLHFGGPKWPFEAPSGGCVAKANLEWVLTPGAPRCSASSENGFFPQRCFKIFRDIRVVSFL